MKLVKAGSRQFQKLCERSTIRRQKRISARVSKIIEDVRQYGDEALIRYTRKFDKIKLKPRNLLVSECETSGAYQNIDPEFVNSLKLVMENINKFYKRQIKKSWRRKDADGVVLGEKITPIETVGVYVPSGTVPLISTVYMTVIPAQMAGVKKIVMMTPPNKYGSVDPHILVMANLLKVRDIYKVGGAQAIAALAFGTKTVPKVDKIVGPGNSYVTEAKRQVFGHCAIDMLAGPTELVVVANQFTNLQYLRADLAAQAEHFMGLAILVTTSKKLVRIMKKEFPEGFMVHAKNVREAADIVNQLAPEHLQLLVNNSRGFMKNIVNAGAIFLGPYSPVSVGDYIAGPSHVLPTGGSARFFSGLGLSDFVKSSHIILYTKKALEKARDAIERIASIEGLSKHLESVKVRFDS
ncbi:MAG: histidinol dehydrogenase [Candidatus Omnitrophota bacterium]